MVSNEWLNGYELGFGSGLSPNGSDEHLLGRILANGLVERVRTRWPDRPAAVGMLGFSWLGWATHKVGKAGQAGLGRLAVFSCFSFTQVIAISYFLELAI
jgi:hypothetical protein